MKEEEEGTKEEYGRMKEERIKAVKKEPKYIEEKTKETGGGKEKQKNQEIKRKMPRRNTEPNKQDKKERTRVWNK